MFHILTAASLELTAYDTVTTTISAITDRYSYFKSKTGDLDHRRGQRMWIFPYKTAKRAPSAHGIGIWCGNSTVGRVSEKLMHNIDAGSSPLCCKGFFSVDKYKIKRGVLRNSIIFLNVTIKSACFEIFYQKSTNEEGKKKKKKKNQLRNPSLLISLMHWQ